MNRMFYEAISFDQNLGDWNVENVSDMKQMFRSATLSTSNYDSLLIGWNSQNLQSGIQFHGGNSTYCLAGLARDTLTNILYDNWSITDGGEDCETYPIELLDFQADRLGDKIKLSWATVSELNNDYFSIERSLDSNLWTELDTLQGAGTSAAISHYQYWDNEPPFSQTYYRLKQVDFDGNYSYSPIVMVSFETVEWTPKVYPNPGDRYFQILLNKEIPMLKFSLVNSLGQQIKSQIYENVHEIDLEIIGAEGIYYAILMDETGKRLVLKILKK